MRINERRMDEVRQRASTMSDFLRLEYLESCLKQNIDWEAKKFCHTEISKIYESKKIFAQAAEHISILAEISLTFKDKKKYYLKEAELLIKSGKYDWADKAILNATVNSTTIEKLEINDKIKELYKEEAETFELAKKFSSVLKIYEKLYEKANDIEKPMIKEKLISLYSRLGKIREMFALKGS